MNQEDNKGTSKDNRKRRDGIIIGIFFGAIFLSFVLYYTFDFDPVMIMYHYTFDNGTQRWLDADHIISYDFKNGTNAEITVEDLMKHLKLKTSIQKVIHLKDGRTDYIYKHTDSIGSKSK